MSDSDTDSDILEATVHGTQDACKKNAAVVIKTENDSTSESEDSSVLDEITNTIEYDVTKTPLVYTTRLDDMNALKNKKSRSCKETAEKILAESKPRYVQKNENICHIPLNNILRISYIQLCSNLQQFNINAKIEAREKIAKQLKMCKPLKLMLTDIMKTTKNPVESTSCSDDASLTCHDDEDYDLFVPVIYCSDDNLPLSEIQKTEAAEIKCNQKTTLAVRQNQSQEADIYIINNGLVSYYRINFTEYNALHKAHCSEKLVLLQYCCWVKREESIKNFIKTSVVAPFDASFMRKPHSCKPKLCLCCCGSRTPVLIELKANKETLKSKLDVDISEPTNLIERAFEYRLERADNAIEDQEKPSCQNEESECYLKCAVIVIKYLAYRVMFEQTKLLGEYYVIGNNGMIESYVKPTTNRSYNDAIVFFKKSISNHVIPTKYLQKLICCWYKREEVLADMRYHDHLSPTALRFIRSPHLCKSDQCKCCCKSKSVNNVRLENITIQKNLYPSVRTLNMKDLDGQLCITRIYNKHDSRKKRLALANTEKSPDINIDPHIPNKQITNTTTKYCYTNPIKNLNTVPNKTQHVINNNIIDLTDEIPVIQTQIQTKDTVTPNREFVDVTKLQNGITNSQTSVPIQVPRLSSSDISYTAALNNISLKDLTLSVNNNGKLIATVNSRPESLTSVELKVISDILALASKQITQLGLTPEDFCKQVNSVRAANLNSLLSNQANKALTIHDNAAVITKPLAPASNVKADTFSNTWRFTTHRFKEPFSKTRNISNLSETYQNMSYLSGHKSMHLMQAYWLHCQVQYPYKTSSVEINKKCKNKSLVRVDLLLDNLKKNIAKNTITEVPAAKKDKRKCVEESTYTHKRIRVIPATELIDTNLSFQRTTTKGLPLDRNVNLRPGSNPCNDSASRNQGISNVNVTQTQPMMTTNQPPPLVSTSSFLPIQHNMKLIAAAEYNKGSLLADREQDVSANNPILNKMLSYESIPPLVPIRLELREMPKRTRRRRRVIPSTMMPKGSKFNKLLKPKQNSERRMPSEINKDEIEINKTVSAEPVFDSPSTIDSVFRDLVVFSDEKDDGIFGA